MGWGIGLGVVHNTVIDCVLIDSRLHHGSAVVCKVFGRHAQHVALLHSNSLALLVCTVQLNHVKI